MKQSVVDCEIHAAVHTGRPASLQKHRVLRRADCKVQPRYNTPRGSGSSVVSLILFDVFVDRLPVCVGDRIHKPRVGNISGVLEVPWKLGVPIPWRTRGGDVEGNSRAQVAVAEATVALEAVGFAEPVHGMAEDTFDI